MEPEQFCRDYTHLFQLAGHLNEDWDLDYTHEDIAVRAYRDEMDDDKLAAAIAVYAPRNPCTFATTRR